MFGKRVPNQPQPGPGNWKLKIYASPDGTCPYDSFRDALDPYTRAALNIAVEEVLGRQGHNVCVNNKIGKNLKKGLYEFKVGKSLSVICKELGISPPPELGDDKELCLRVFFSVEGNRVVVLFAGYDKGRSPGEKRQAKEIRKARTLLEEHRAAVRRAAKGK